MRNIRETHQTRRGNCRRLTSQSRALRTEMRALYWEGLMFSSAEEVLRFIAEENVEFIDVRFCDLPGTMQHFTVPSVSFGESVFTDGLMFDGSSIRGLQQIHESDMQLLPDPSTAYMDPFRQHSTMIMNFFIHDPLTGEA